MRVLEGWASKHGAAAVVSLFLVSGLVPLPSDAANNYLQKANNGAGPENSVIYETVNAGGGAQLGIGMGTTAPRSSPRKVACELKSNVVSGYVETYLEAGSPQTGQWSIGTGWWGSGGNDRLYLYDYINHKTRLSLSHAGAVHVGEAPLTAPLTLGDLNESLFAGRVASNDGQYAAAEFDAFSTGSGACPSSSCLTTGLFSRVDMDMTEVFNGTDPSGAAALFGEVNVLSASHRNVFGLKSKVVIPSTSSYSSGAVGIEAGASNNRTDLTNPGGGVHLRSTGANRARFGILLTGTQYGFTIESDIPPLINAIYYGPVTSTNAPTGAAAKFILDANGHVGIGVSTPSSGCYILVAGGGCWTMGGTFNYSSSRKLKTDIHPLSGGVADRTFARLEPVSFRYKKNLAQPHMGFIAEDVPDLIAARDRKSIGFMGVTALTVSVLQGQQHKLDDLSARVAEKHGAVAALKARIQKLKSTE